ncbi:MAG: sugar nucleotide-binding protein, partial [Acidobacteriota bacterium]|nr:sugar nucleotide-binding protein [Acidobacteriota bacterium]
MRTLIFGGTGMLGSALVAELRRRSQPALGLSHAQGDITDPDDLRAWMRSFRPQVVVNCAAFTKVDDCEEREDHAQRINGEAVAEVAAAADEAGAKLIQVSTDYVFDGTATEPYAEDAATGPRSAYGRSKLLGEENALAYPRNLVVRVSWLFGPGGPNFVATMLRLMAAGHRTLRVVDDQVG